MRTVYRWTHKPSRLAWSEVGSHLALCHTDLMNCVNSFNDSSVNSVLGISSADSASER